MFKLFVAMSYLISQAALGSNSYLNPFDGGGARPSEYIIQNFPDEKLITVKLLGGVAKPGIYRIPQKTTVLTLLTYSGGLNSNANSESLTISGDQTNVYSVDKILLDPKQDFFLQPNQTIFIPAKQPPISQDTMTVITFISATIGLIVSAVALTKL